MKSIYLDDFQLHSLDTIWTTIPIEGLEYPEIRSTSYDRSGEHGAVMNNVLYGKRLITLSGKIASNTLASFEQKRRAFEAALRITLDENRNVEGKLLRLTTLD